VVLDNPTPGLQEYVLAPLAVRVTLPPLQKGAGVETVIMGCGFTVTIVLTVLVHPLPFVTVYEIVVVPGKTADTIPLLLTVAMAGLLLDQEPPGVEFERVILLPTHTFDGPLMAATVGSGFTVMLTEAVEVHEPDVAVIVNVVN
jgi:hypothetical protein